MNAVIQFPDVAGPVVFDQFVDGRRGHGQIPGPTVVVEKPLDQGFNIVPARTQGRQLQGKHVQPVKQVLAKAPRRHLVGELTVGGGNNADIQVDQFGTAQALNFPLLQHPQQFRLQLDGHLGDLVEQQRAAVGLFELAGTGLVGAGEGTLFVTKENRLQHVLGNRRTVQCHKGPIAAVGTFVHGPGQDFLASTRFTADQHRGVGQGDPLGEVQHVLGGGVLGNHF